MYRCVALTHQFVADDRKFAENISRVNLILGGHEHDAFIEEPNGVPLLKVTLGLLGSLGLLY